MKASLKIHAWILLALVLLYSHPSLAWFSEDLTFAEFYKSSHTMIYVVAAIGAAVAVITVLLTGGASAPGVAAIGSWIGGMMGLSGAAATNAGLALLGGGALTAGGLGMAGGAALLSAAMTFTTSVGVDYAVKKYDEKKFIEASEKMIVLPLPLADRNISSLESAMAILENIDKRQSLSTPENKAVIHAAAMKIDPRTNGKLSKAERAQKLAFLALLQLNSGEPGKAQENARTAYVFAKQASVRRTFPAAVYALASLSDPRPNFNRSVDFLEFSAKNEDTNELSAVMFAAFLDRLLYRADDIPPNSRIWDRMVKVVAALPYDERKATIENGLTSRLMMRSLVLMKRIQGISHSNDEMVWSSTVALSTVTAAYNEYQTISILLKHINDSRKKSLGSLSHRKRTLRHPHGGLYDWEAKWQKFTNQNKPPIRAYVAARKGLAVDVATLTERQNAAKTPEAVDQTPTLAQPPTDTPAT
jgi:hypothetical protein